MGFHRLSLSLDVVFYPLLSLKPKSLTLQLTVTTMNPTRDAKTCDSCLKWHLYCKAECCKTVSFTPPSTTQVARGKLVAMYIDVPEDQKDDYKWYYDLHNIKYSPETNLITFRMVGFKIKSGNIILKRRCSMLDSDNRCIGHPNNKPNICKRLNAKTYGTDTSYPTPNCLFKYKKEDLKD